MRRPGELRLQTPEGVTFAFRLASPMTRLLARAIDTAAILVIWSTVSALVAMMVTTVSTSLAMGLLTLGFFVLQQGYAMVLESRWQGQTLGKRVLGLRVLDQRGFPAATSQIIVRNLLRFVDVMPMAYLLGGAVMTGTRHLQRLGDIAAGTVVIRAERDRLPDARRVRPDRFNSLRRYPAAMARLRQTIRPAEARLAYRALLRRDEFEPEARVRLFAELAEYIQELVPLPAEATENLSPEAFLRNVVDVLLEVRG